MFSKYILSKINLQKETNLLLNNITSKDEAFNVIPSAHILFILFWLFWM